MALLWTFNIYKYGVCLVKDNMGNLYLFSEQNDLNSEYKPSISSKYHQHQMSYLPKSGISPRKSWKIHSSTKIKVLWTVHKWHHLLWGEGDLPKGDNSPWSYLVKWVTRGREGSKISKKLGDWRHLWTAPTSRNATTSLCYFATLHISLHNITKT